MTVFYFYTNVIGCVNIFYKVSGVDKSRAGDSIKNKLQLDTFLKEQAKIKEMRLKNLTKTDISLAAARGDLENIKFTEVVISLKDGDYRFLSDNSSKEPISSSFINNEDKNIRFTIHPRFLEILEHSHNFIEMIFVYSGECHQIINGKRITLHEGDICLLDTNVKHDIQPAGENDIIVNCIMKASYFDFTLLGRLSENDVLSGFFIHSVYQSKKYNEYIIFPFHEDSSVKKIMTNILCEYYDKTLCSTEVINCYMVLLFAELLRSYKNSVNEQNYSYLENTKISDIVLYLENNYKTATLESVAKHFHFNPSYLSTTIKKLTGQKFLDMLHEIKVKNAYGLLRNSDLSIAQIANEIGYSNISFFYQIFKKKYGITPAELRRNSSAH